MLHVIQVDGINAEGVDRSRRAFLDLPGRSRNSSILFERLQVVAGRDIIESWGITEEHVRYTLYCEDMSHEPDIPKGTTMSNRVPFMRIDRDGAGMVFINRQHLLRLAQL